MGFPESLNSSAKKSLLSQASRDSELDTVKPIKLTPPVIPPKIIVVLSRDFYDVNQMSYL